MEPTAHFPSHPKDLTSLEGPFDIIGDVHGCYDELVSLLAKLGIVVLQDDQSVRSYAGRRLIFVGDLVDRGPKITASLRLIMHLVEAWGAIAVLGNRDAELLRHLQGEPVKETKGMSISMAQLGHETPAWRRQLVAFLSTLRDHHVLDHGRLAVAHAGLQAWMIGRDSPEIFAFAVYGPEKADSDNHALPERIAWAADYSGETLIVYGHTPTLKPAWLNHTVNIDTGCVYGGKLTALRYPELSSVSVPAKQAYNIRPKPFLRGPE